MSKQFTEQFAGDQIIKFGEAGAEICRKIANDWDSVDGLVCNMITNASQSVILSSVSLVVGSTGKFDSEKVLHQIARRFIELGIGMAIQLELR